MCERDKKSERESESVHKREGLCVRERERPLKETYICEKRPFKATYIFGKRPIYVKRDALKRPTNTERDIIFE